MESVSHRMPPLLLPFSAAAGRDMGRQGTAWVRTVNIAFQVMSIQYSRTFLFPA